MEMKVIIGVPNVDLATELHVAMKMKMVAPKTRDSISLRMRATAVTMASTGATVEVGTHPSSQRPGMTFLSWDWDDAAGQYVVVTWRGDRWVH